MKNILIILLLLVTDCAFAGEEQENRVKLGSDAPIFRVLGGYTLGKNSGGTNWAIGSKLYQEFYFLVGQSKESFSDIDRYIGGSRSLHHASFSSTYFLVGVDVPISQNFGLSLTGGLETLNGSMDFQFNGYSEKHGFEHVGYLLRPSLYMPGKIGDLEIRAGLGISIRNLNNEIAFTAPGGQNLNEKIPDGLSSSIHLYVEALVF